MRGLLVHAMAAGIGLAWLLAGGAVGQAQGVYRPLPLSPPAALPPVPSNGRPAVFDAFAAPPVENRILRPWETRDVPFGAWGSQLQWDPRILASTTIRRYRHAFVQKTRFNSGYVYRNSERSLGYSWLLADITMVVPLGSGDRVLAATPRYRVDWVSGPDTVDVPPRLYSAAVDVGVRLQTGNRFTFVGGVQPGWYNDQQSTSSGFRLGALLLLIHDLVPEKFSFNIGVARLDRNDYDIVPVLGATWVPNPDTRFDLTFPRPKIARRVGHIPCVHEDWVYVSGFFGGGTWAVRREAGFDDELTLRDFRISIGAERVVNGGTGFHLEAGLVFGRKLEYQVVPLELDFDDTFMLEAGFSF